MNANLFLLILALCAPGLAGCSNGPEADPAAPTSTNPVPGSPTSSAPAGGSDEALPPSLLPIGTPLHYSLAPGFNSLRHVDMDLTTTFHASGSVTMKYAYPERPEFDTNLEGEPAADGSWANVTFDCAPVFPDERNIECDRHRAGYGVGLGLDGPLFGTLMLAGLPVRDGEVVRTFPIGTQSVELRFSVVFGNDTIDVQPVDLRAFSLGRRFSHSNVIDPIGCTILTARVTLQRATGLPLACIGLDEEDGTEYPVWLLADAGSTGMQSPFRAVAPASQPSGDARHMPPSGDSMPFTLQEALDVARNEDPDIARMLDDPAMWHTTSSMIYMGNRETGACPVCLTTPIWEWDLRIVVGQEVADFKVTKWQGLVGPEHEYSFVERGTRETIPQRFPATLASPDEVWTQARNLLGFSPVGIVFQMPYSEGREDFVSLTGATEPYYFALFNFERGMGAVSEVAYRADGTLELFMADGAIAHPDVEGA